MIPEKPLIIFHPDKMKRTALLFLLFFCVRTASAQQITINDYQHTLDKFMRFYNAKLPDSMLRVFSAKTIKKEELTVAKMNEILKEGGATYGRYKKSTLYNTLYPEVQFKTEFEKGSYISKLAIDSTKKIETIYFEPYTGKDVALAAGLKETNVEVAVDKGKLYGSLIFPAKPAGKIPLVIIISGSGPTDRNGNSVFGVDAWSYRHLSNELGKKGIATLLYDKRLVGQSKFDAKETGLRFADYVNDLEAWIKKLKADKRFSTLTLVGHSDGNLIAMLQKEKVSGLVSLEGVGRPLKDIMKEGIADKKHPEYARKIDSLSKGLKVHAADDDPMFRPSLQPFYIETLKLDPAMEIKKLTIPVLIVQGITDTQVGVKDAQRLKAAYNKATLKMITGMNHMLKAAPADPEKNDETYKKPQLPVKPELVSAIENFCTGLK